jgi:hypothetical protein
MWLARTSVHLPLLGEIAIFNASKPALQQQGKENSTQVRRSCVASLTQLMLYAITLGN